MQTQIPREVGLGGSSAIITATLRALCTLAAVDLDPATIAATRASGRDRGPRDRRRAPGSADPGARGPPVHGLLGLGRRAMRATRPALAAADVRRLAPRCGRALVARPRRTCASATRPPTRETLATLERIAALAERGRSCLVGGEPAKLGALMAENVAARAPVGRARPPPPAHGRAGAGARRRGQLRRGPAARSSAWSRRGLRSGSCGTAFAAEGCELARGTPAGRRFFRLTAVLV